MAEAGRLTRQDLKGLFRERLRDICREAAEKAEAGLAVCALSNLAATPELASPMAEIVEEMLARLPAGDDALPDGLIVLHAQQDGLAPVVTRQAGPWRLHFNRIRALRPIRIPTSHPVTISPPFEAAGFHFCRPEVEPEIIWKGSLAGREAWMLFNKYAAAPYHIILVPEPRQRLPQVLSSEMAEWFLSALEEAGSGRRLVGAFNGAGAHASVNHLHFHLLPEMPPTTVELPEWEHNGGHAAYPAECAPMPPGRVPNWVHDRYNCGEAFNMLVTDGIAYGFRRKRQGGYVLPGWSPGVASMELAGEVLVQTPQAFDRLTPGDVERLLAEVRLDGGAD